MSKKRIPRLILAPMEGVMDVVMRDLLTHLGGVDLCVSEFIRVTYLVPPIKVIRKIIPEMDNDWKTSAGTPVMPQILGSDINTMAITAKQLIDMGAPGVDINFGCPAKTVNRHDGGASLLRKPKTLLAVLESVKAALPEHRVTAKIRLGWDDPQEVFAIIQEIKKVGLDWLTVHARTKCEGYKPPAHWNLLKDIREQMSIPVIANGDIFTVSDYIKCKKITGCDSFMIGRGMMQTPNLIQSIKNFESNSTTGVPLDPMKFIKHFIELSHEYYAGSKFNIGRLKQLARYMANSNRECAEYFDRIKRATDLSEVLV